MADYNYGYGQDYGQEFPEGAPKQNKSIKGYQIIIIVLAVILAALSFLYYNQMNALKKEYAIERDTLTSRISLLMNEYDELRTENDTIAYHLEIEREKADSLLESLTKERNLNRATIRKYEKELGTLRAVMQNYVHQIDSLNTLNQQLIRENAGMRQTATAARLRAEKAEEKADELSTKIRQGAVIRVRDIDLVALSNKDREVTRAKNAARLRVRFVIAANELSQPGPRPVFVRITGPEGYIITDSPGSLFDYEGEKLTYSAMREVDYANQDLDVSVFYNGTGIIGGKYTVEVFIDGYLSGKRDIILR